jgi:hypothetical protein
MSFQNLFITHDRPTEVDEWLNQEIAEQQQRYDAIVKTMEELGPTRDKWYEEFLERIQKRGFNVDGDMRVKIKPEDIPVKPDRPHKVVY